MLIIALILFGMIAGAAAQLVLGRGSGGIDWAMAFVAGLAGSFVGGLLSSLLAGDGLDLRPSGIIGSIVGAVIVTAIWRCGGRNKPTAADRANQRSEIPRQVPPALIHRGSS